MEEIPLDDVTRNPEGSFTVNRPGIYTFGGHPIAKVTLNVNGPDSVTVHTDRQLPQDEPIGNPVKWRAMTRAQRRAAKRHRK